MQTPAMENVKPVQAPDFILIQSNAKHAMAKKLAMCVKVLAFASFVSKTAGFAFRDTCLTRHRIRTAEMRRLENPIIIDIEASGFGSMSYPIEVGIALDDDTKYCSLILPASDWEHWDSDAEKVHRIARDILETYGNPIQQVAAHLNRLLEG